MPFYSCPLRLTWLTLFLSRSPDVNLTDVNGNMTMMSVNTVIKDAAAKGELGGGTLMESSPIPISLDAANLVPVKPAGSSVDLMDDDMVIWVRSVFKDAAYKGSTQKSFRCCTCTTRT